MRSAPAGLPQLEAGGPLTAVCLAPTGSSPPPGVTPNLYKSVRSSRDLAAPPPGHAQTSADLPSPSTLGALAGTVPPLSQAGLAPESPREGHHQGRSTSSVRPAWAHRASPFSFPPARFLFPRSPSCPDPERAPGLGPHPEHQLPGLRPRHADPGATRLAGNRGPRGRERRRGGGAGGKGRPGGGHVCGGGAEEASGRRVRIRHRLPGSGQRRSVGVGAPFYRGGGQILSSRAGFSPSPREAKGSLHQVKGCLPAG